MAPSADTLTERTQVIEIQALVTGGPRGGVRAQPHRRCRVCGERAARFYRRGGVAADRSHTLCFECYRAVLNQARARRLASAGDVHPLASSVPVPARASADREGVYRDLTARRRQAQLAARHAVDGWTAQVAAGDDALQRVS